MADHIDRAIDDTARALTAGEPDVGFRARVIARLDARAAARRRWWIAAPITAAALIGIALITFSGRERTGPAAENPVIARGGNAAGAAGRMPAPHVDASTAVARGGTPTVPRTRTAAPAGTQTPAPRVDASTPPERTTAANNAAVVGAPASRGERARTRRTAADASDPSPVSQLAPPPLDVPSIALAPIDGGPSLRIDRLAPIAPVAVAPLDNEGAANRELRNQNREPSSFSTEELR